MNTEMIVATRRHPFACGLGAALNVISGKWKATLIWELHVSPLRFGELKRRVPGISEKILYEQLRELEADGVVQRAVLGGVPPKVEYSLTEAGLMLNEAVHALAEWGRLHTSGTEREEAASPQIPTAAAQPA